MKDGWLKELSEKPKLAMLKMMLDSGMESSCAHMRSKNERKMIKLRGGTAPLDLQIKVGRWQGVRQEERASVQAVRVTIMIQK